VEHVDDSVPMPSAAKYLGYGGVIPFAAMALNQLVGGPLPVQIAQEVFLYYSAAILSFLGGIRWGGATRLETRLSRELVISVIPSLWAVACLLLDSPDLSVWWLLAGFVAMGVADVFRPAPGLALWMRQLRLRLTIAVVICHLVMAASLHV
jgi:hypothetical protein